MSGDEVRSLSSYALGQLLQKNASVEVAVRQVLRVATLKNHLQWRIWAMINLTTVDPAKESAESSLPPIREQTLTQMHHLLDDFFPPKTGDVARQAVLNRVIESVTACRRIKPGRTMADSVTTLERRFKEERRAIRKGSGDDELYSTLERILDRIKTQAQMYLSSVESGSTEPSTFSGQYDE